MSNAGIGICKRVVSGNPLYDDDLKIAPWKIDVADFAVTADREIIGMALAKIKTEHALLVLASVDGSRYANTVMINFDDDSLEIDKPFDFDATGIAAFRIYFKDVTGVWSFFGVELLNVTPFSLCSSLPGTLHRLKKRQHHRVTVPDGTRVLFRYGSDLHENFLVKDLSASGMLICGAKGAEEFVDNGEISEISLALPRGRNAMWTEEAGAAVILPVTDRGRIVRSFGDQEQKEVYHGISFKGDSTVIAELDRLLGKNQGDGIQ